MAASLDAPRYLECSGNCCEIRLHAESGSLENCPWYLSIHQETSVVFCVVKLQLEATSEAGRYSYYDKEMCAALAGRSAVL